jgi:DNA-binding response OmpR family regulator
MLAWSLHEEGYEVTECDDGYCLMKQLGLLGSLEKIQRFDLIISDIRMPGVTGMQVLESAREFEDFPPMILITAFGDDSTHAQAQKLGTTAMLDKPFDIVVLLTKIAQLVRPQLPSKKQQSLQSTDKELAVQFPMDIVFRHNCGSEPLKAFVQQMASRFNRYANQIVHCWVVIDVLNPHRQRQREHRYHVNVNLTLRGETVVVKHHSDIISGYENAYLAIQVTFGKAYHQLKHHLDKHNRKKGVRQKEMLRTTHQG